MKGLDDYILKIYHTTIKSFTKKNKKFNFKYLNPTTQNLISSRYHNVIEESKFTVL